MEVVEKPLSRRSQIDLGIRFRREPRVDVMQDSPGVVQARQQTRLPESSTACGDLLSSRYDTGPLGEMIRSE